jgi:glycosyltransferase involved in cell wall biosynthesis
MAGITVLSPLPPGRSDASMAGSALVRVLRRTGGNTVRAPWPIPESVEALLGVSDLAVYHLSGDLEDREIYEMALERPGLVILHDLVLDRLVRGLMRSGEPMGIESARETLAVFDRLQGAGLPEPLVTPWCALAVRRARGLVVHSAYAARYVSAMGARTPVFVAPHPSLADRVPQRAARRRGVRLRRRLPSGAILGVIGEVGPEMGLEIAVEASRRIDASASVVAIGPLAGEEARAFMGSFDAGPVTWAVHLPEDGMVAWLAACDVVLDLRDPPRATVATSVVRAMQLGVPVVASSPMSVPDGTREATTLLSSSPSDPSEVADAVGRVLAEHQRFGTAVSKAAEWVSAGVVPAYAEAVDRTVALLRDPVRWSLGRWAAALVDAGVPEGWVRRGYGAAYTDALEELRPG